MVEVLIRERHSRKAYISLYFMIIILIVIIVYMNYNNFPLTKEIILAIALFSILGIAYTEIHRLSQSYELNTDFLVHQKGIAKSRIRKIDISGIRGIVVDQSAWQRLLRFGTINLQCLGQGKEPVTIQNVNNPKEFIRILEDVLKDKKKHV